MNWYYSKDGAQHGPVALEEIQAKLHSGAIARDALVWREGMTDWTPANTVAEFSTIAANPTLAPGSSVYAPPAARGHTGHLPIANARPTSGLAIASLICGIIGLTSCILIPGIAAVICGHMAMPRTDPQTGNQGGRGMAVAGLVMGYICAAFLLIFVLYFVIVIPFAATASSF